MDPLDGTLGPRLYGEVSTKIRNVSNIQNWDGERPQRAARVDESPGETGINRID